VLLSPDGFLAFYGSLSAAFSAKRKRKITFVLVEKSNGEKEKENRLIEFCCDVRMGAKFLFTASFKKPV
jgi:hypothetical protein